MKFYFQNFLFQKKSKKYFENKKIFDTHNFCVAEKK